MIVHPEDLRPVPTTPLRTRNGVIQQECVVTRYDQETGRQQSQVTEWRDVVES